MSLANSCPVAPLILLTKLHSTPSEAATTLTTLMHQLSSLHPPPPTAQDNLLICVSQHSSCSHCTSCFPQQLDSSVECHSHNLGLTPHYLFIFYFLFHFFSTFLCISLSLITLSKVNPGYRIRKNDWFLSSVSFYYLSVIWQQWAQMRISHLFSHCLNNYKEYFRLKVETFYGLLHFISLLS